MAAKQKVNHGFVSSNKDLQSAGKDSSKTANDQSNIFQGNKKTIKVLCVIIVIILTIIIAVSVWFATKSVDGGYSSWSRFSPCTKTCGGGTKTRTRQCDNPLPRNGGKKCQGPAVEVQFCVNKMCQGSAGISMTQQLVQDIMLNYHTKASPTKKSSGRFQKAIFTMQRDVANEQAFENFDMSTSRKRRAADGTAGLYGPYDKARTPSERLDDMRETIKIAVNMTSKDFARAIFAKSLYVYIKKRIDEGVPIPEISKAAQGYLEWIKKDIGEQNFSDLMLESGGATLMFAIDTTGSMSDEINAAKAIATSIVNRKRQFPVDYILSPFNDPGTGPITYKSPDGREDFVSAIGNLNARGGGDCPELAFKGMIDAFRPEPQIGSPMFVFTDATPKDGTISNIDRLKWYAEDFSTTINFFIKNTCSVGIDPKFSEIASYTSGQIFPLKTDKEIEKFKDYVDDCLKDSVIITEGKSGSDFYITIDGEITTLLISLELKQADRSQYVKLVDPFGDKVSAILTTTYSCVFKQEMPMPGTWHLKYPAGLDITSYVAKSVGNNTVDFATYFLHEGNGSGPVLSVTSPVKDIRGSNTTAMLQLSGTGLLIANSLSVDVLSETGRLLQKDVSLEAMPGAESIVKGIINTPNGKFKLRLKGNMTNGQNFTRLSQTSFKASNIVLLTIRAGHDFSATVRNRTVPIKVYLYSNAEKDMYRLTATSTFGSVQAKPSFIELAKGANTTVTIEHTLPANAHTLIGKLVTITMKVRMDKSVETKEHQVKMIYVP